MSDRLMDSIREELKAADNVLDVHTHSATVTATFESAGAGMYCPKCGEEYYYGDVEFVDSNLIKERSWCDNCNTSWTNYFSASYIDSVIELDKPKDV